MVPIVFWRRRILDSKNTGINFFSTGVRPGGRGSSGQSISLRNRDSICVDSMRRKNGNSGPYQGSFFGSTQYLQLDYFAADKTNHHGWALPYSVWNLQQRLTAIWIQKIQMLRSFFPLARGRRGRVTGRRW